MGTQLTVEATVLAVESRTWQDKVIPTVVLDTTDNAKYPERLAVEYYGKSADCVSRVRPGDRVRAVARVKSRAGKDGRWFTSANGYKCEVLGQTSAPSPAQPVTNQDRLPDAGGEKLPF